MDLEGASAIVSGGAGGLGDATVRRFAGRGMPTVIADLDEEHGTALAADLGDLVRFVQTDVADERSVQAAVDVARELGILRVSVAAHGAGAAIGRVVGRDGTPIALDGFERTIRIYLTGSFNLLRLAAAAMCANEPEQGGSRGLIVNTASIAAYEGQVGQAPYAAAKAGVVGMTLAAARDLAAAGVRVMTIAPGTFYTPAFHLPEEEAEARWGGNVPFPNRMGRADEYAQLVEHLATNDYLNGEVIRLDGALRFAPK